MLVASAAEASIAWEGVKAPLWEDSVVVSAEVLGLVAKEALATVMVLGQDLVVAAVALVEASVVVLVALVEDLMSGWEVKAFLLAHRVASGK